MKKVSNNNNNNKNVFFFSVHGEIFFYPSRCSKRNFAFLVEVVKTCFSILNATSNQKTISFLEIWNIMVHI